MFNYLTSNFTLFLLNLISFIIETEFFSPTDSVNRFFIEKTKIFLGSEIPPQKPI
jgi:hypothetical protein